MPKKIIVLPMIFAALVRFSSPVFGESVKNIYAGSRSSVVLIITYDSSNLPLSIGSGFFSGEKEITTNFHVIDGSSKIICRVIGEQKSRPVINVKSVSKSLDLALLEVDAAGPVLSIREGGAPDVGEKVVVIGNPRGLEGSLSEGIVSGLRQIGDFSMIQITAPISPGSSGGPVLDDSGRVVGVATMTLLESQNLNFAVPASLIAQLRSKGAKWEPVAASSSVKTERGTAGLKLVDAAFDGPLGGVLSYSIKNTNTRPIQNLAFMLVFRNSADEILHYVILNIKDVIPPGLSVRRRHSGLYSDTKLKEISEMKGYLLSGQNPYPFTPGKPPFMGFANIELRPLSYDFVNGNPEDDLINQLK